MIRLKRALIFCSVWIMVCLIFNLIFNLDKIPVLNIKGLVIISSIIIFIFAISSSEQSI